MADTFHRSFFLAGPAGRLQALLWTTPVEKSEFSAVVCHPHPLYGGTMHNKVVYQAAKRLHEFGVPVLRFNFRGVGLSEGEHDKARGEQEDVRAALDYLAEEFAGKPILVAGFSFGSIMGMRVGCEDERVTELIGMGIPVTESNVTFLQDCTKPKLIIQGGEDRYASREKSEAVFATMAEPKKLVIVEGGDHFFTGHLAEAGAAIDAWLRERHRRTAMHANPDES